MSAVAYCELCGLNIPSDEFCDGCLEDPDEYEPRHAVCCEIAEEQAQRAFQGELP